MWPSPDGAGARQPYQHRLLAWHMAARLDKVNPRQERRVAVNDAVAHQWPVPLCACRRESFVTPTRGVELAPLHYHLGVRKRVERAHMVRVEMSRDDHRNIGGRAATRASALTM